MSVKPLGFDLIVTPLPCNSFDKAFVVFRDISCATNAFGASEPSEPQHWQIDTADPFGWLFYMQRCSCKLERGSVVGLLLQWIEVSSRVRFSNHLVDHRQLVPTCLATEDIP